jgi:phage terminase large subunit-like protein
LAALQAQIQQSLDASQTKKAEVTSTYDADPVNWIETYFTIPETSRPIELQPYQRAVIQEALSQDEHGLFNYSTVVWADIKKSAKSTIAGAVGLWMAWHHGWETVRIVANDLRQANSRTFFYIKRAIKLNPRLAAFCLTTKFEITLQHNNTTLQAIPVDPKGEAGGGDLITIFTELWAAKNEAAKTLWSETTLSPLKFGRSIRWVETYAGFEGGSPVLEPLYETGVKNGRLIDVGIPGLELYANESARMLTLWNTQPRCAWQTDAYYKQEAATLVPSEYERMHRNQWQRSSEAFAPLEWWDACKVENMEALRPYQGCVMALDAAVDSDCFAISVWSVRQRDGENIPQLRYARIWTPPQGGKIQFVNPGNAEDTDYPEGEVRRLIKEKNIVCIAYDATQLEDMANRLGGLANWEKFDQGKARAIADKRLFDMVRDRRIEHSGELDMREHFKNANRKPEGNHLRIVKGSNPNLKIDLLVTASMAVDRSFDYNL